MFKKIFMVLSTMLMGKLILVRSCLMRWAHYKKTHNNYTICLINAAGNWCRLAYLTAFRANADIIKAFAWIRCFNVNRGTQFSMILFAKDIQKWHLLSFFCLKKNLSTEWLSNNCLRYQQFIKVKNTNTNILYISDVQSRFI